MDWLRQNSDVLNVALNGAMLLVWVLYLQVFLSGFRRQRRAMIVIGMGAGPGLDARCLLSNMSEDSIYVANLIARVEAGEDGWDASFIDRHDLPDEEAGRDPMRRTRQGPLGAGDYMDAGAFGDLLARAVPEGRDPEAVFARDEGLLTVEVVALYAAEDLPVAARRRFRIRPAEDGPRLEAVDLHTEQIRSHRQRRKLARDGNRL
ncbi:hypothetical protein [uncultured Jannaschia sp.]|uniref:hypothetical protein n=1 Tax=uncultured Jannaschia sp. TaxID=293347 RepID=UPI00261D0829|nr:hypothetical protein [uncultured Jannaschia sp.]